MRLFDGERIEKPEHGSSEITEGIGPIDAFCRSPVAGQVRNDQPEMPGQRCNVAAEVGYACRARSPAMEQEKRGPVAELSHPDLSAADPNVRAPLQTFEWKWFHSIVLPDVALPLTPTYS